MKIVVDRGKCIAAANCIGMAPRVFALDGQKKAIVLDSKAADNTTLINAAELCPTEAISLFDEESDEQIFP
jgi:ferredoxin